MTPDRSAAPPARPLSGGVAELPPKLAAGRQSPDWETLHVIGNGDILQQKCLGLLCSIQCPGSVVIKTFDAVRELRDAGVVVAGGFHSPLERECLEFLLRGEQPVVICPARHPSPNRLPAGWRAALKAGRLLIVSPFGPEVRRTTKIRARTRNEFVAALSTILLIPHASPGGQTETIARHVLNRGQPLLTFDDEENDRLLEAGARPYGLAETTRYLSDAVEST